MKPDPTGWDRCYACDETWGVFADTNHLRSQKHADCLDAWERARNLGKSPECRLPTSIGAGESQTAEAGKKASGAALAARSPEVRYPRNPAYRYPRWVLEKMCLVANSTSRSLTSNSTSNLVQVLPVVQEADSEDIGSDAPGTPQTAEDTESVSEVVVLLGCSEK